jgi:hypothetical protein
MRGSHRDLMDPKDHLDQRGQMDHLDQRDRRDLLLMLDCEPYRHFRMRKYTNMQYMPVGIV